MPARGFRCSLLFVFLRKRSLQKAPFPTPSMWLWLVVGLILSLSVLIIAGECFTFLLSVKAGAPGLKQLNKDKLKAQQDLQQCRTALGSAGRLHHNLGLSPCQIQPTPGVWRFLCSTSFLKSPLWHSDPPLLQDTTSSKYSWHLIFVPPVSCPSLTLYSQHSQKQPGGCFAAALQLKAASCPAEERLHSRKAKLERLAQEL